MDELTLAIDASTYDGSVALICGTRVIGEQSVAMKGEREERLMPAVASVLAAAGVEPKSIARVVCGAGPGAFTPLRIAAAIAKALVRANGAGLFAVPSLALAAVEAGKGKWCVTLDAMRGERFSAVFEWDGIKLTGGDESHAPRGNEAIIERARLTGATVVAGAPHARAVAPLLTSILASGPVDLASWEPSYGRLAEAQVRWEAEHGTALPR